MRRMLSVLLVHLSGRDGGAERQTVALASGLVSRGHRALALVRRGTPLERRALGSGAPVFPLGPRFPIGPGGTLTPWSRGRARLLAARGNWDLIHFSDPEAYAATAGLLAGAAACRSLAPSRLLVTYRGERGDFSRGIPGPLRRQHRAGGPIQAVSEALWAALVREGFDEDRLSVVHPGVPVKSFAASAAARVEARRELGLAEGEEAVGTTAILDRERGLADLIDAAAILSRVRSAFRLLVVGEGPRRRSLESQARRSGAGDRIRFLGWREDVARILQSLDCWVYAGAGQETFPLSLIEAMAAGVPVVASDQPGIREIIENGKQGLFVPGRGAEPLARTILRVLAEREEGRRIGRAGAVRVQRFHTRAMVETTEALYYRLARAGEEA